MTPLTPFEELVMKMRLEQKAYFATRARGALIAAKQLEKEVDKHLNIQEL